MKVDQAIASTLEQAKLPRAIAAMRNLSGGCIHQVMEIELADGRRFVAKLNAADKRALFDEEAHSLRALAATNTVLAPQPLAILSHSGFAVLLMTHVNHPHAGADEQAAQPRQEGPDRSSPRAALDDAWLHFGAELAALHDTNIDIAKNRYGFDRDNHIGTTLQPNAWHNDWVAFNAINRLGFQMSLARDSDLLTADEARQIEKLINDLDQFIPRRPKPALLHGDLWSGNALSAARGGGNRIAVIDPACSIGDGAADLAMMQLFGGFPQACFDAYWKHRKTQTRSERETSIPTRIAIYQLYHVLNHINIFGRGYAAQAMSLVSRIMHKA